MRRVVLAACIKTLLKWLGSCSAQLFGGYICTINCLCTFIDRTLTFGEVLFLATYTRRKLEYPYEGLLKDQ